MRFLCRIGWHEWGKFEDALFEAITTYNGLPIEHTKRVVNKQVAYCKHCNKRKIR